MTVTIKLKSIHTKTAALVHTFCFIVQFLKEKREKGVCDRVM